MPRRPARAAASAARATPPPLLSTGVETVEDGPDGTPWSVRRVTGSASARPYRCPGCDQEVVPGTPHVVAWPEGRVDERRHWHGPCWSSRARRRPRVRRSRDAPRY